MAPTIAATSNAMKWLELVVKTLADCLRLQAFVGTGSATAAKGRIHIGHTPPPTDAADDVYSVTEWQNQILPCVEILPPTEGFARYAKIGTSTVRIDQACIVVFSRIEAVELAAVPQDGDFQFADIVLAILEEFQEKCGLSGYCEVHTVNEEAPAVTFEAREENDLGRVQKWAWRLRVGEE